MMRYCLRIRPTSADFRIENGASDPRDSVITTAALMVGKLAFPFGFVDQVEIEKALNRAVKQSGNRLCSSSGI